MNGMLDTLGMVSDICTFGMHNIVQHNVRIVNHTVKTIFGTARY